MVTAMQFDMDWTEKTGEHMQLVVGIGRPGISISRSENFGDEVLIDIPPEQGLAFVESLRAIYEAFVEVQERAV